jgi:hypothetical protein
MIKFLFVTFLIFLFFRLVAPTLFKWLLGMFIKKKVRNGSFFYTNMNQQQRNTSDTTGRAEGKVKIDYIPEQPDKKGFDGGEYVDYEEVK